MRWPLFIFARGRISFRTVVFDVGNRMVVFIFITGMVKGFGVFG
jgi:hypothetical protein